MKTCNLPKVATFVAVSDILDFIEKVRPCLDCTGKLFSRKFLLDMISDCDSYPNCQFYLGHKFNQFGFRLNHDNTVTFYYKSI